jgi:hypothetical protein
MPALISPTSRPSWELVDLAARTRRSKLLEVRRTRSRLGVAVLRHGDDTESSGLRRKGAARVKPLQEMPVPKSGSLQPEKGITDPWCSTPLLAPLFGPIPVGGASKDWLESRGPV